MTDVDANAAPQEEPASAAETRGAYLDQSIVAYLLYGVGAVTAFLAAALALSDTSAGLHSSLMAVGLLAAGIAGDRLDTRLGPRRTQLMAYAALLLAVVCLATAPAFAVTLLGAALVGLGAGLLLAHLNRTLTRGGGTLARVRMSRSALVAMVTSLCVPLAIGLGESAGSGWQIAFVVPVVLVAIGFWASRSNQEAVGRAVAQVGRLGRGYWLAWWLVVLGVSVEFSLVFWSSTLVERQAGISLEEATLIATSFYAGMATSRVAVSLHQVSRHDPVMLMRLGLLIALAGSLLAWAAQDPALAGVGIYLGGAGTGFLYPLGVAVALALVPGLQDKGSARLIIASGVAILVAPFVLGVAADAISVSTAWLLIPAICAAALLLSVPVGRSRRQAAS